jgi:hypothetical protein
MTNAIIENWFKQARANAAQGNLVVVCDDGKQLLLPALQTASVKPEMVMAIEQIIPSTTKRRVAVIGETSWASSGKPNLQAANQAIPFWGLLMGLASIGHAIWVFNGSGNLLCAGCNGADVLIVDSNSLATLPGDWQIEVAKVMRNPQILVHDRASYKLLYAVVGSPHINSEELQ